MRTYSKIHIPNYTLTQKLNRVYFAYDFHAPDYSQASMAQWWYIRCKAAVQGLPGFVSHYCLPSSASMNKQGGLEGEPAAHTLQCTPLLVEKAGVASDVALRITVHKQAGERTTLVLIHEEDHAKSKIG